MQIVGVAGNGKYVFIAEEATPFFYVPLAQDYIFLLRKLGRWLKAPPALACGRSCAWPKPGSQPSVQAVRF